MDAALRVGARRASARASTCERTLDWLDELDPGARAGPAPGRAAARHRARVPRPGLALRLGRGDWALDAYVDYHQGRCAQLPRGAGWPSTAPTRAWPATPSRSSPCTSAGGWPEADLLQAADSLSFIETMAPLVRRWIADGTTSRESALAKLRFMWERIRVPAAHELGRALDERALRGVQRGVTRLAAAARRSPRRSRCAPSSATTRW